MPIEKMPINPITIGKVPSGFIPHKVKDNESWGSIAKIHQIEVWELIYENFKTRDTAETNWYLKNYVGCNKKTSNGDNWLFSSSANPGIIYVPMQSTVIPPAKEVATKSKLKNVWAGLAKAHSGDFFMFGAHDLTGMLYNLGDDLPEVRNALININGYKMGPGLGASIGAVIVIAHGYTTPQEMNGVDGGWDFDLAVGAKLGDLLKGIKGLGKAIDTIQKYKKLRYLTENAIKNMGITERGIYTIPIPLAGVGLHGWLGFKFGDVSVFRTGKGIN